MFSLRIRARHASLQSLQAARRARRVLRGSVRAAMASCDRRTATDDLHVYADRVAVIAGVAAPYARVMEGGPLLYTALSANPPKILLRAIDSAVRLDDEEAFGGDVHAVLRRLRKANGLAAQRLRAANAIRIGRQALASRAAARSERAQRGSLELRRARLGVNAADSAAPQRA